MARSNQPIRQWKILKYLEANGRSTLSRLIRELEGECHPRTLRRDLVALGLAGYPIYDSREDGKTYWVLDNAYRSFPIPLTPTELLALDCGRELLRPLDGTFVSESLDRLYGKARAALSTKHRRVFEHLRKGLSLGPSPHGSYKDRRDMVDQLHAAIEKGRMIEMAYASGSKRRGTRKADPYLLHFQNGVLYLIAYCHRNRAVRTFSVDRIQSLRVTDRQFQLPLYFDIREYFKEAFGVYRGKAESVRLTFEKTAARWVRERTWHPSQMLFPLKGRRIEMALKVAVTPELLQWVLGFGPQVKVAEPVRLARMVQEAAWGLLGKYEKSGRARIKPGARRKKEVRKY